MTESDKPLERLMDRLARGEIPAHDDELVQALDEQDRLEWDSVKRAVELLAYVNPKKGTTASDIDRNPATTWHELNGDPSETPQTLGSSASEIHALPERIGHYEIQSVLGAGGFGWVVLARDTKLGRQAALKIPRIESIIRQPDAKERFTREARLVALLSHPAIVPVYETGVDGSLWYIAMAYCNGETLARYLMEHPNAISPREAAEITSHLAAAVQHAHIRGVIHRDLKPGNVLLHWEEESHQRQNEDQNLKDAVRIVDFGLAKLTTQISGLTQTGDAIGTPAYMSPEQAAGAVDAIGPASDVYALGAIFYELLTGRPPVVGESSLATLRAVERTRPQAPSSIRPAVPADLSAICLQCLEKSPGDRYSSAQALADDLDRYLRGEPVEARPLPMLLRLWRWAGRNPALASAASITIAALLIASVVSAVAAVQTNAAMNMAIEKQQLADQKSSEALTQARLARGAVDRLQRAIAKDPKVLSEGMEGFRLSLAAAANEFYQQLTQEQPDTLDVLQEYVDTLKSLAYLQQLIGQHEDAIATWKQAAELTKIHFPADLVSWCAIRSKLAEDLLMTGRTQDAIEVTNEVVNVLKTAAVSGESAPEMQKNLVFQLVNHSQNLNHHGDSLAADSLIEQAIQLTNTLTGVPPEQWPADRLWARVARCKTEVAGSREQFDQIDRWAPVAVQLYTQVMAEQPQRTSEALDSLATLHQHSGVSFAARNEFQAAYQAFDREREVMQQLIKRHPDVAGLCFNWSQHMHRYTEALVAGGEYKRAEEQMRPHLEWLVAKQQEHPQLKSLLRISEVECRRIMGQIQAEFDKPQAASDQLREAIRVVSEECASDQAPLKLRTFWGRLLVELGLVQFELEQVAEAKQSLDQATAILTPLAESPSHAEAAKWRDKALALLAEMQ